MRNCRQPAGRGRPAVRFKPFALATMTGAFVHRETGLLQSAPDLAGHGESWRRVPLLPIARRAGRLAQPTSARCAPGKTRRKTRHLPEASHCGRVSAISPTCSTRRTPSSRQTHSRTPFAPWGHCDSRPAAEFRKLGQREVRPGLFPAQKGKASKLTKCSHAEGDGRVWRQSCHAARKFSPVPNPVSPIV